MPAKYKIKISNFQSIKELEFELDNFVTLVGKSNRGKSAIVRALRVLFYNDWNASFIRHGEKECCISLEFLQPTSLKRIAVFKSKDRNEYEVENVAGEVTKFPKIGKDTPDIFKTLNLSEILSDRGDSYNLNFASQFDEVFMLGKGEAATSSFINRIFDISRFERALKDMKADDIRLGSEVNETKQKRQDLQVKQSDLSVKSTALDASISSLKNLLSNLKSTKEAHTHKSGGLKKFQEITAGSEELKFLEEFRDFVLEVSLSLAEISTGFSQVLREKDFLKKKDVFNTLSLSFGGIESLSNIFKSFETQLNVFAKQKIIFSGLQEQRKKITSVSGVESLLKDIYYKSGNLEKLGDLKSKASSLSVLRQEWLKANHTLPILEEVHDIVLGLKHQVLHELGKCPTCGKKVTGKK